MPSLRQRSGQGVYGELEGNPYWVHLTRTDRTKFAPVSSTEYYLIFDEVANEQTLRGRTSALEDLETNYGIKLELEGLVFDPDTRAVATFPEKVCWNRQHNLCS